MLVSHIKKSQSNVETTNGIHDAVCESNDFHSAWIRLPGWTDTVNKLQGRLFPISSAKGHGKNIHFSLLDGDGFYARVIRHYIKALDGFSNMSRVTIVGSVFCNVFLGNAIPCSRLL